MVADNGPIIVDGIGDREKVAPVSGKYQIGIRGETGWHPGEPLAVFHIPCRVCA